MRCRSLYVVCVGAAIVPETQILLPRLFLPLRHVFQDVHHLRFGVYIQFFSCLRSILLWFAFHVCRVRPPFPWLLFVSLHSGAWNHSSPLCSPSSRIPSNVGIFRGFRCVCLKLVLGCMSELCATFLVTFEGSKRVTGTQHWGSVYIYRLREPFRVIFERTQEMLGDVVFAYIPICVHGTMRMCSAVSSISGLHPRSLQLLCAHFTICIRCLYGIESESMGFRSSAMHNFGASHIPHIHHVHAATHKDSHSLTKHKIYIWCCIGMSARVYCNLQCYVAGQQRPQRALGPP